jgi:hypothetical protein
VDVEGKREPGRYPMRVGGFDCIWDGGPVTQVRLSQCKVAATMSCGAVRSWCCLDRSIGTHTAVGKAPSTLRPEAGGCLCVWQGWSSGQWCRETKASPEGTGQSQAHLSMW